ncbi:MAG: twin transmembrane helix small protein [Alphaproteobacteria bacterium]|nr:twin transmembrane helix small protein [Alphaproteobacteria bacterium]
MTGNFLIGLAVAMVAVILLAGLYTLWAGGEVSRNWSNRLMRMRVVAQALAVLIILAVLYFSGRF